MDGINKMKNNALLQQKKDLYQKIADLTRPKCAECRVPLSCCSAEYCHMTIELAKESYGIDLKPTNHPTLPLMGEYGCIAEPYLRPACALHLCSINSLGFDKDPKFNKEYYQIRGKIEKIQYQELLAKDKEKKEECPNLKNLDLKKDKSNYPQRTIIEFDNREQDLTDWAKEKNIPLSTLHRRLYRSKWPLEKALTLPVNRRNNKGDNKFCDVPKKEKKVEVK